MQLLRTHKFITICVILAVIACCIVLRSAFAVSEEEIADRENAIEQTVRERALQCYVIEDAYPESLAYLEENYGLQVNTRDYYIRYDIFASNIAPQITVTGK